MAKEKKKKKGKKDKSKKSKKGKSKKSFNYDTKKAKSDSTELQKEGSGGRDYLKLDKNKTKLLILPGMGDTPMIKKNYDSRYLERW